MLRIQGFSFIPPLISNIPYTDFFRPKRGRKLKFVSLDGTEIRNNFTPTIMEFGIEHIDWIEGNFNWLHNNWIEGKLGDYDIPFAMITNSIYAVDPKVRFTTAWIGIEALLKPPISNLGKNLTHRLSDTNIISKRRAVKLWYKYRCKIIHGEAIEEDATEERTAVDGREAEALLLFTRTCRPAELSVASTPALAHGCPSGPGPPAPRARR